MSSIRQIRLESGDQVGARIAHQTHRFPVRSADTGGRLALSLIESAAGGEAPALRHTAEDVVVCVLDGSLEGVGAGGGEPLGPGDIAFVPRGCRASMRSGAATRLLVAYAPGAVQGAFRSLGEGSGSRPDAEIAAEFAVWGVELLEDDRELAAEPDPAPTIVRADQGERFWLAGDEYTIKIDGNATGGRFCVVHFRIPPGAGPLVHTHSRDEEIFHLVKGRASFWSGGGILEGSEGDTVVLPRSIPHAFRNRTDREAEFLAFFSPAGFDEFLRSAGRPATAGATPPAPDEAERDRLLDAATRYGLAVHGDVEW